VKNTSVYRKTNNYIGGHEYEKGILDHVYGNSNFTGVSHGVNTGNDLAFAGVCSMPDFQKNRCEVYEVIW
jgi:hypothetical protein